MLSNYLAEIWGISLVIVSLALIIKEKHLKKLFVTVENEDGLFFWGLVTFIMGLAMVLAHNVWVKNWTVIITIFGWASLLKGLALLFIPEIIKKYTKKVETFPYLSYCLMAVLIIGLILTYLGFTA